MEAPKSCLPDSGVSQVDKPGISTVSAVPKLEQTEGLPPIALWATTVRKSPASTVVPVRPDQTLQHIQDRSAEDNATAEVSSDKEEPPRDAEGESVPNNNHVPGDAVLVEPQAKTSVSSATLPSFGLLSESIASQNASSSPPILPATEKSIANSVLVVEDQPPMVWAPSFTGFGAYGPLQNPMPAPPRPATTGSVHPTASSQQAEKNKKFTQHSDTVSLGSSHGVQRPSALLASTPGSFAVRGIGYRDREPANSYAALKDTGARLQPDQTPYQVPNPLPSPASAIAHSQSGGNIGQQANSHHERLRKLEYEQEAAMRNVEAARQRAQKFQQTSFLQQPPVQPYGRGVNLNTGALPSLSAMEHPQQSIMSMMTGYVPPLPQYHVQSPYNAAPFSAPEQYNQHGYHNGTKQPYPGRHNAKMPPHDFAKEPSPDDESESDDDEPLQTRVQRHPSVQAQRRVRGLAFQEYAGLDNLDSDFEILETRAVAKPQDKNHKGAEIKDEEVATSSELGDFSYALPKYEIQRQPLGPGEDLESVKVSLPNMVREELYLSPDHTEQEIHLLMNVFLPNQQALTTPDTAPAVALLNFHTIAIMVIEAYVQFEIGDIQGLGRGHFHNQYDRTNTDYERMRDAKDADQDEIFFAVVDRWRTGIEIKKPGVGYIRGAQEFCDVALDIIYYIKENGLLVEPKRRKARASAAQGNNKPDDDDKGKKRAAPKKGVNELQGRKKTKTESAAKPKHHGGSVTVMRRR